jgi:phenylacetic acid degradation operon negative regulatory protein
VTEPEFRFKGFLDIPTTDRVARCHDLAVDDTEPRTASATELLPTLLGDYWFTSRAYVPSAALVRLLGEFGVGADATRAALSRLARAGRLEGVRDGRRTAYRLAPALVDAALTRGRHLMAFGAQPTSWDGVWTCVAFSVPEADGHLRPRLRARLRALGMGALFDGLWITPHAPLAAIERALDETGVAGAVVFRATEVPRPAGTALVDAWDLAALRRRYDDLLAVVEGLPGDQAASDDGAASDAGGGGGGGQAEALSPAEALVARTDLMRRWRALAMSDPRLPDLLLPDDWPLAAARARFVAAYDALGPLAEERVRALVGDDHPRHHRVADIAGAGP